MNPKRKAAAAAAAALTSASGSAPAAVTAPTAAFETQDASVQLPQATAISAEVPLHSDTKEEEDMSRRVGLATEQGKLQDTSVEHESSPKSTTAAAGSLSPVPVPSAETTGTTSTEPVATFADSSEATLDSAAEPDTEEPLDISNASKKRVGSEQDRSGVRGGGAKRRFTNPKPGRRLVG
ncbi:hypothetical protein BGZ70_007849 [Mortierella alpina]|uniref:Uncharacterized protein n=1 Tax=Mortierella alpina TaxID=64518 RepID=A0A9P6M1L5_MORAP|nr:hypothetical protein BGZ70_007849 [Mortierella alpina]